MRITNKEVKRANVSIFEKVKGKRKLTCLTVYGMSASDIAKLLRDINKQFFDRAMSTPSPDTLTLSKSD